MEENMDFVNVLGSIPTKEVNKQLTLASINVTKKTLISIISGLKQKNFGYDTMQRTVRDFRQFKNNFAELVSRPKSSDHVSGNSFS